MKYPTYPVIVKTLVSKWSGVTRAIVGTIAAPKNHSTKMYLTRSRLACAIITRRIGVIK